MKTIATKTFRLFDDHHKHFSYLTHFFSNGLNRFQIIVAVFLILGCNTAVFGASATLTWNSNTESDLSGYKVYFGTASGSYGTPIDVGNTTSYTVSNLANSIYYFAVTAYDTASNESSFSSEVSKNFSVPDTTSPVISAINSSNISSNSATITWTTDEASDTQIEYGTTTAYGSVTSLNSTMVTSHSGTLASLLASTTYHFRVLSRDASGNTATSGDNTFSTTTPPDTTAPSISGIASSNLTTTSATISWTTNEPSDTRIEYGTNTAYGSFTTLNSNSVTSHSQTLTGLSSSTTYHFRVLSRDGANNLATSGDNTITTQTPSDTTSPVVSGITASNITETTAVITWATDEGATSQVEYGTTTGYGSTSLLNTTSVTSHSRTLSGLVNGTTYHYRVISADSSANSSTSGDSTFTTGTPSDTTSPVISGIASGNISSTSVMIRWTTNEGATSQVEYGPTTAYGSTSSIHSTLVTNHSRALSALTPGTTIHYRVISRDAVNNTSTSADKTFTTSTASDTTAPAISTVAAGSVSKNSVTITWTTDEPATSQIEFGLTSAYGTSSVKNETLLMSHTQTLTGLSSSTSYHFRVKSMDTSGNGTTSGDITFTTTAATSSDTTPPADIKQFTATGGNKRIALSWTNPDDTDFVGVRIRFRTDNFPNDINDGELLGDISGAPSAGMGITHTGLSDGVTYYYLAAAYDGNGNYQKTVFVSGTTNALGRNDSSSTSSGGGGCGIIRPGDGEPPKPGDAAAMLTMIALMLLVFVKKAAFKVAVASSSTKSTM